MTHDKSQRSDHPDPMIPSQTTNTPHLAPTRFSPGRGWLLLGVALLAIILVPYFAFETWIMETGSAWLETISARPVTAAAAVISLLAADVLLPIPSSIVGVFAGNVLGFARGAAVLWTGLMAGCVFGYWLGAHPGRRLARSVVGSTQVMALQERFGRLGPLVLVLARAVPVLAEASVVAAGAARLDVRVFLAATATSNVPIALAYAGIGAVAAETGSFLAVAIGLIAVPTLAWTLWTRTRLRPSK